MKLDILKASLLAVVFAFGCNSLVLASDSSSSSSDSVSDDGCRKTRTRHTRRDDCSGIEDKTAAAQQRAGVLIQQFSSGISVQQTAALRGLYRMLGMECQDSKMAAGNALLVIIQKMNPHHKPCEPCGEKSSKPSTTLVKAFTVSTEVHLDSCKIARLVERFSRSYNEHLLAQAKASMRGKPVNQAALAQLQATMSTYSNLSYYVNLVGQAGLQIALTGSGTLDVMFDPCANPCAGLCPEPKPCKPCGEKKPSCDERRVDQGTRQAIDKIIAAFKCSSISECISGLLGKVSAFGTKEQKETIEEMMEAKRHHGRHFGRRGSR